MGDLVGIPLTQLYCGFQEYKKGWCLSSDILPLIKVRNCHINMNIYSKSCPPCILKVVLWILLHAAAKLNVAILSY